ncbi:MAG TPA: hypothetical protein VGV61_19275 [Thermoanaerobaculia bacterium]|nr:hypothetical protein [Thermoanaerobaculia bacterium]
MFARLSEPLRRSHGATATAAAAYAALTLVWFRPVWRHLSTAVTPDAGDPWLCLYFLEWGYRRLGRGLNGVWSPPFFFPTRGALALSDHLLGPAVMTAPLRALTGSEVLPYNLLVLTSFFLCALVTYFVCRRRGLTPLAAFAAGLVFAGAPFRWDQLSHLAILLAQWVPLTVWAWDELLATPSPRRAALFLGSYLLQVTGGTSLAYMVHLPLVVLAVLHLVERGGALLSRRSLRVLAPTILASALAAAAVFVPYWQISHRLGMARQDEEIRSYGARATSFVLPSHRNLYVSQPWWEQFRHEENVLFPGFVATLLAPLGLLAPLAGRRAAADDTAATAPPFSCWDRAQLATGVMAVALCFAGVYLPLAGVVPGLHGMRAPARFFAIALLPIAWFAGRGVEVLRGSGAHRARGAAVALLVVALAVESTPRRLEWVAVPTPATYPPVYHWLARQRDVTAIVELPFTRTPAGEVPRMLYQTLHGKPLANGYSGYSPPSFTTLQASLHWPLRAPEQFNLLRWQGISHVVVRGKGPDGRRRSPPVPLALALVRGPGRQAELVYADPTNLVYRLLPPPGG